jgi:hypothetical protein
MLKVANSVINASQITGVLPVVNGGTGVTTATGTGNTVLSAAPTLSGDVTLSTGNLIPNTALKGINFTANTPLAGMTSQLLNSYEEGTFTPFISFGGGVVGITYNTQTGLYTRVGRVVTVSGHIYLNTKGSSTGVFELKGLPYTSNSYAVVLITYRSGITYTGQLQAYLNASEARVTISTISTVGTGTNLTDTAVANNLQFYFSCTYHGQ